MTQRARGAAWSLVCAILAAAMTALGGSKTAASGQKASSPHRASITQNLDCANCHSQTSWKVDGSISAGQGGFDHARTGFPLSGRHRAAGCVDCHHSERPASRACVSCHSDAHQRLLGQACDRCHTATSWSDVSGIRLHRSTRLPLSGMHVLAACSECHVRSSENTWRGVPADCYACHAGDYARSDIHPLHRGVPGDASKPALPKNCAGCHRTTGWTPAFAPIAFRFREQPGVASQAQALSRFQHDAVFPLSFGKHRRVPCADCHVNERAPRLVQCTGCHAHDAARLATQHRNLGPVGAACLACHPGGSPR
jgi:hypothetical protein